GKACVTGLGMLKDRPGAVESAAGIGGQGFRAGIENAAIRTGAADHGRIDVQRAIVPGGDTGSNLHSVIVDVGARTMLGGALELADILQVRRAAGGAHRGGPPEAAPPCGRPAITTELSAATVMLALACSAPSRAIFSSPIRL